MYATWAVFSWSVALRLSWLIYCNLTSHIAHASVSATGAVLVTIPTSMHWAPGQHAVLRFLAVRPLESHPYSLATVPQDGGANEMCFVIVPQSGFSKALAETVKARGGETTLRVLVDGPFGAHGNVFRGHDATLLVAGGSGVGHVLPIFLDLVKHMKGENAGRTRCARVELVWVVRSLEALHWFEQAIVDACADIDDDRVTVRVYITSGTLISTTSESTDKAQDDKSNSSSASSYDEKMVNRLQDSSSQVGVEGKAPIAHSRLELINSRPDVRNIVIARSREWSGRVAVAACGPQSLTVSCGNAVAEVQLDILSGAATCDEMYMHSELYSW